MNTVAAVILAAGKGTRMKSGLVKVLHPAAGRPMIGWAVDAARAAGAAPTVLVVGHQAEAVRSAFPVPPISAVPCRRNSWEPAMPWPVPANNCPASAARY